MLRLAKTIRTGAGLATTAVLSITVPLGVVRDSTETGIAFVFFGAVVAILGALRLWSMPQFASRPTSWWLWGAAGATTIGLSLWAIDVYLGFVVLAWASRDLVESVANPMAALISAAFFPLAAAISIGSAVRAALSANEDVPLEGG